MPAWPSWLTAEPSGATAVIVQQGPWAAAALLVSLAAIWLVKRVIERGWQQHDAAIAQLQQAVASARADTERERARADAADARTAALERDYREKVVPVLTDVYRVLADLARRQG